VPPSVADIGGYDKPSFIKVQLAAWDIVFTRVWLGFSHCKEVTAKWSTALKGNHASRW